MNDVYSEIEIPDAGTESFFRDFDVDIAGMSQCIEEPEDYSNCLDIRIFMAGDKAGYGEWSDSKNFKNRLSPIRS